MKERVEEMGTGEITIDINPSTRNPPQSFNALSDILPLLCSKPPKKSTIKQRFNNAPKLMPPTFVSFNTGSNEALVSRSM